MQSPSSLIFLVLLGIWAAYFVQYWVRRRDHLATAHSVDQFTAAMRVLERRDAALPAEVSEPTSRAYALHPARADAVPAVTERVPASPPRTPSRSTATGSPAAHRDAAHLDAAHLDAARREAARGRRVATVRPRVRPSRRVRGLFLLASLVAVLAVVPLVVLAVLPVWAVAPAVVVLGGALLWARSGARTQQALIRAHRRRQAELARLRVSAPVTAPVVGRRGAAGASRATPAPASTLAHASSSAPATSPATPSVESTPVGMPSTGSVPGGTRTGADTETAATASAAVAGPAVVAPAADVMVPILDEDDMPLTWDPVPVPRPTYTMKAKAERREVEPAAVTPDPAPVARSVEGDTAYDQRRAAGA